MQINLIAPICSNTSYGLVSINLLKELHDLGHQVSLFPINPQGVEAPPRFHEAIKKSLENARLPDWNAPCVRLWHQFDMSQFVGYGPHIGFPIFELDQFNDQEKHHLASLEKILVCSEWAKGIVGKELEGRKDVKYDLLLDWKDFVHVVSLGVDTSIFHPGKSERNVGGNTVFFTAGKWEIRKGHDVLVECFNKAFSETDNVELWMMCDNIFNTKEENQQWENLYKSSKLGSKIRFIPRVQTQEEVSQWMQSSDFGIFLSRAEGFNLEALEMLACGKKIIITDYTGHTEFCNIDNSCRVRIYEKESAFDGKWFFNQGNWGVFDYFQIEQTVEWMQHLHKLKQDDKELIFNKNGVDTARKFSWRRSAECLINALS